MCANLLMEHSGLPFLYKVYISVLNNNILTAVTTGKSPFQHNQVHSLLFHNGGLLMAKSPYNSFKC